METFRRVLPQGLGAPKRGHDSGSFLSARTCLAQTLVLLSPAQSDGSQTKQKAPGVRQGDRTSSWDTGEDPPPHWPQQTSRKWKSYSTLGWLTMKGGRSPSSKALPSLVTRQQMARVRCPWLKR